MVSPAFLRALLRPRVLSAVSRALGDAAPVFHFTNITQKATGFGSGIAWHRDAANRYITTRRRRFLHVLVCLDAMGPGNDGTGFLPGSHRGAARMAVVPRCRRGTLLLVDPPRGPDREAVTGRSVWSL
nr:phytanoyl-CoA dioxygenase family protein [Neoroseomonas eburnea]